MEKQDEGQPVDQSILRALQRITTLFNAYPNADKSGCANFQANILMVILGDVEKVNSAIKTMNDVESIESLKHSDRLTLCKGALDELRYEALHPPSNENEIQVITLALGNPSVKEYDTFEHRLTIVGERTTSPPAINYRIFQAYHLKNSTMKGGSFAPESLPMGSSLVQYYDTVKAFIEASYATTATWKKSIGRSYAKLCMRSSDHRPLRRDDLDGTPFQPVLTVMSYRPEREFMYKTCCQFMLEIIGSLRAAKEEEERAKNPPAVTDETTTSAPSEHKIEEQPEMTAEEAAPQKPSLPLTEQPVA